MEHADQRECAALSDAGRCGRQNACDCLGLQTTWRGLRASSSPAEAAMLPHLLLPLVLIVGQADATSVDEPPEPLSAITDASSDRWLLMKSLQGTWPGWLLDSNRVQNGLVTGSDVFIDPAASPTYIGSVKWAPSDGQNSVLFAVILGPGRYNQTEDFNNPQVLDLVYTHKVNGGLTYTLDSLFGYQTNLPDIGTATWFGVANYLTYQITPRLSGTTRLEFFNDIDGNRTGFKGLYTALTAGLNFQPRRDIIIRPEIRYDYNNESRPFESRHGLFTVAADVILRW
jgi:hypothetical protein